MGSLGRISLVAAQSAQMYSIIGLRDAIPPRPAPPLGADPAGLAWYDIVRDGFVLLGYRSTGVNGVRDARGKVRKEESGEMLRIFPPRTDPGQRASRDTVTHTPNLLDSV